MRWEFGMMTAGDGIGESVTICGDVNEEWFWKVDASRLFTVNSLVLLMYEVLLGLELCLCSMVRIFSCFPKYRPRTLFAVW